MSLFVNINAPENDNVERPIDNTISFVAAHAEMENRHGCLPAGPSLDITFKLPKPGDNSFVTEMRMGGYNLECDTLFFEAMVPEQFTEFSHAPRYVAMVMQSAVESAKEYFDEIQIDFDITTWRQVMGNLVGLEAGERVTH